MSTVVVRVWVSTANIIIVACLSCRVMYSDDVGLIIDVVAVMRTLGSLDSSSLLRMMTISIWVGSSVRTCWWRRGCTYLLDLMVVLAVAWIGRVSSKVFIMVSTRWVELWIVCKGNPCVMNGRKCCIASVIDTTFRSNSYSSHIEWLLAHSTLLCDEAVFNNLVNVFSLTYSCLVI